MAVAVTATTLVHLCSDACARLLLRLPAICQLVLDGKIDDALTQVVATYPGFFVKEPGLLFRLKCRKFTERVAYLHSQGERAFLLTAGRCTAPCNNSGGSAFSAEWRARGTRARPFVGRRVTPWCLHRWESSGDTQVLDAGLEELLALGQGLQSEFDGLANAPEPDHGLLQDTFSLLAYTMPSDSPVA